MKKRISKQKLNRYRAMMREVADLGHPKGTPIDPGIKKVTALFNLLGFRTASSCEGHLEPKDIHLSPWIHFWTHSSRAYEKKLRTLIRAFWSWRYDANVPDARAVWMYDDLVPGVTRPAAWIRVQVGINQFSSPRGKKAMPPLIRRYLLKNAQQEMKMLERYLWKRYIGELKSKVRWKYG